MSEDHLLREIMLGKYQIPLKSLELNMRVVWSVLFCLIGSFDLPDAPQDAMLGLDRNLDPLYFCRHISATKHELLELGPLVGMLY